jgi:hypothetical protein
LIVALNNIPVDAPAIPVLGATEARTTLAAVDPVLTVYDADASPATYGFPAPELTITLLVSECVETRIVYEPATSGVKLMLNDAAPAAAVAVEDVYVFETVTESVKATDPRSKPVADEDCVIVNFAGIVLPDAATPATKSVVKLRY